MNWEALFRWIITILLIVGVFVMYFMKIEVPEWLIALTSGAVGNTARLQFTKPKVGD